MTNENNSFSDGNDFPYTPSDEPNDKAFSSNGNAHANDFPNDFPNDKSRWVPEEALANLVLEKSAHPNETYTETSRRIIDENSPIVVQSLLQLALYSKTDRIRLDAGKYILDRALGKVGEEKSDDRKNPTERLIDEITQYVAANSDM